MHSKIMGCILLVLGTSVGAGTLALPIAAAQENYFIVIGMMLLSWLIMTLGALSVLEVNLWMPSGANLITMANNTLGKYGAAFAWLTSLLLQYSLLCAYLSGSSDIMQNGLDSFFNVHMPRWIATCLVMLILGSIVSRGTSAIDWVNRGLMGIKLLTYAAVVAVIVPHVHVQHLMRGDHFLHNHTWMIMVTSFGYATIIPSFRSYLKSNSKHLIKVVWWGGLLSLIIYLFWIFAVQGLFPKSGAAGLLHIGHTEHANTLLMNGLKSLLHSGWMEPVIRVFVSICALTSFLGVSLSLTDFMADGLRCSKQGPSGIVVYGASYLPPLLIVLLAPGIFINALHYAGICCVLLLIMLPIAMLYSGRYIKRYEGVAIVCGGKWVLIAGLAFAVFILCG